MTARRAVLLALVLLPPAAAPADGARRRLVAPPPPGLPSAAEVVEREFAIDLSRRRLAQGRVRLTVRNAGEDDHDLTLLAGGRVLRSVFLGPGATRTLRMRLSPGRYLLVCTIADHRALGMRTVLRIG